MTRHWKVPVQAGTVAAAALLLSCATTANTSTAPDLDVDEATPVERAIQEALAQTVTEPAPPPDEVTQALLSGMPGAASSEPRFDVSVHRAAAAGFFMSLVEGTPYNMVVHPEVRGEISLQLKSVTIPEVMATAESVYGFGYARHGSVFRVLPARLQTRTFQLDYLNLHRAGQSQTRVSSGQVSEQLGGSSSGSKGSSGSDPKKDKRLTTSSGSVIQTATDSNVWNEVGKTLHQIIGDENGRRVVISPNAGIITVRAMPAELRSVTDYLAAVHANLGRQVVLEAKIIEVTLSDAFRSGINWAYLSTPGADDSILGSQTGGGSSLPLPGLSEIAGNAGDLFPGGMLLPINTATSAFGGVFSLAVESDEFSAFIELLETQGDTQVLSSPRISTLNNQKAVIKVGTDEFFVTNVSTTTVTGAATTTSPDIELTPFFSGIALDVTPNITAGGVVTLHIHPSVSEVNDQTKRISIGGDASELEIPLAVSTIRETDSIVRARSGQVIVIGGLMQDSVADENAGTPWLHKIPLLGNLFEQSRNATLKQELVILLRPIVVTDDTWHDQVRESQRRMKSILEYSEER